MRTWRRTVAVLGAVAIAVPLTVATAGAAPPRGTADACPPDIVPDSPFTDAAGPFEDAIACVALYGITQGRTATTFEPGRTVTRGQLASFTRSLLDVALEDGFPTGDGRTDFSDVDPAGPHAGAIDALADAEPPVLEGFEDGTYRPSQRVNRAQAASIVDRALRIADPSLDPGEDSSCRFTDGDRIAPVHRGPIARLCALGVAAGRDDGRFDPTAGVTRGQAAAFLARAVDVLAERGLVAPPFTVSTIASGLDHPWEIVITSDDRTFVTERGGRLLELVDGDVEERHEFDVVQSGEGGLLGLAEGPDGDLYAYLTAGGENRVVRFDPDSPSQATTVLDGIPAANTHNGGRLAFGPDGMLYVATGDAQDQPAAQDLGSLAGKILRVTPTGGVPDGNPFGGSPVWSLGHRNVQGLAFDADDRLWATEFGPNVDDEVNVIVAGANYGWPEVTGTDTTSTPQGTSRPAVFVRQPAEASWSGATFTTEPVGFAGRGALLVAAQRGERLYRLGTDGTRVTGSAELFEGDFGRIRTVVNDGDGGVLIATTNGNGSDRIVRIGR